MEQAQPGGQEKTVGGGTMSKAATAKDRVDTALSRLESMVDERLRAEQDRADDLARRWKAWMAGGAICSEMEAATIFIVAATLRARAGGAMLILGNPDQRPMT